MQLEAHSNRGKSIPTASGWGTRRTLIWGFLMVCCVLGCSKKDARIDRYLPQVERVSVYYLPWSVESFMDLSCTDLQGVSDSVVLNDQNSIEYLERAMQDARLILRPEIDDIDVRICCVFWDTAGTILHTLAFTPTLLMQIDDKVYERDQQLFETVLSFLPKDYLET